ncbi:MAG: ribonuclease HII [Bacillota bacterium]
MKTEGYTIKELKNELKKMEVTPEVINELACDSRKGVTKLARKYQKKIAQKKKIRARWFRMRKKELSLWDKEIFPVAGLDEAGRGPLAGPVVASAVIFTPETEIPGIDDSKKLSCDRREQLFSKIKNEAQAVGVGIIDNETIDQVNIQQASFLAMKQALADLSRQPEYILVDGSEEIPGVSIPQQPVIKGDSRVNAIAAASIIAKVTRDRILDMYDEKYPEYGFINHKGYGTEEHIAVLKKLGPTPIHRYSYSVVKKNS